MSEAYIPIFFDWMEVTEELTAQEKGRLIDAIVEYGRGGNWQELIKGNERYLFPAFRQQIDRDRERRNALTENGRKGGQSSKPKQSQANGSKTKQGQANRSKVKQMEAKPSKPKQTEANSANNNNNNNNNKEDNEVYSKVDSINSLDGGVKNNTRARAREEATTNPYGEYTDTVQAAASTNLTGFGPANYQELEGFIDDLPDEVIKHCIAEACAHGKPYWSYVRSVLWDYVTEGVDSMEKVKAREAEHKAKSKQTAQRKVEADDPYRDFKFF